MIGGGVLPGSLRCGDAIRPRKSLSRRSTWRSRISTSLFSAKIFVPYDGEWMPLHWMSRDRITAVDHDCLSGEVVTCWRRKKKSSSNEVNWVTAPLHRHTIV